MVAGEKHPSPHTTYYIPPTTYYLLATICRARTALSLRKTL